MTNTTNQDIACYETFKNMRTLGLEGCRATIDRVAPTYIIVTWHDSNGPAIQLTYTYSEINENKEFTWSATSFV